MLTSIASVHTYGSYAWHFHLRACLQCSTTGNAYFLKGEVSTNQQSNRLTALKPTINPMIGPSSSALITLGARFPPCMKYVPEVPPSMLMACLFDVIT